MFSVLRRRNDVLHCPWNRFLSNIFYPWRWKRRLLNVLHRGIRNTFLDVVHRFLVNKLHRFASTCDRSCGRQGLWGGDSKCVIMRVCMVVYYVARPLHQLVWGMTRNIGEGHKGAYSTATPVRLLTVVRLHNHRWNTSVHSTRWCTSLHHPVCHTPLIVLLLPRSSVLNLVLIFVWSCNLV